jgi:hypothetical protein
MCLIFQFILFFGIEQLYYGSTENIVIVK